MNFYNPSDVPNGPRAYRNNGARNNRANNSPPFVPTGPRSSGGNQPHYNANANQRNNGNGNRRNPANGHGSGNQWSPRRNDSDNVSPRDNGTVNGNSNYKGRNFNPNYKGKNYNPNFSRAAPPNVGRARNGYREQQHNGDHYNPYPRRQEPAYNDYNQHNQPMPTPNYNIDIQMADAPSDEPNDIEMPDAPPLSDPRIEAFTMGALAVKEIADSMLQIASQWDPTCIPN
ncbi:unnamed protein product [Penicillium glandicola]